MTKAELEAMRDEYIRLTEDSFVGKYMDGNGGPYELYREGCKEMFKQVVEILWPRLVGLSEELDVIADTEDPSNISPHIIAKSALKEHGVSDV